VLDTDCSVFAHPLIIAVEIVVSDSKGFEELPKMVIGLLRVAGIHNDAMPEFSRIAGYVKHDFKSLIAGAIGLNRYPIHYHSVVSLRDEGVLVNLKIFRIVRPINHFVKPFFLINFYFNRGRLPITF
jgi:hypothetical protein